ncbi:MAG TPA: hypothetical protein VGN57_07505 [Pirellulaceae bacterium]|jgi:hypothetical protein|nr:hypothetical protein [Pirellulaceae bacterium]
MSEKDNPYRFTGGTAEGPAPVAEIEPRLTLHDLKDIARGLRRLAMLLLVHEASNFNLLVAFALMPSPLVHARGAYVAYAYWFMIAGALVLATLIGMFFVGSRLDRLVGGRFAGLLTIGLLFPGLNAICAVLLLISAKRTLLSRNVRLGWLRDDLSEADPEPSF